MSDYGWGVRMDKKVKDILDFLMEQGKEITRDVLEEKLEEAYKQGRIDSSDEWIERTLNDIYHNIVLELDKRKNKLAQENFYNEPSMDAQIEMRAYDLTREIVTQVVKEYRK